MNDYISYLLKLDNQCLFGEAIDKLECHWQYHPLPIAHPWRMQSYLSSKALFLRLRLFGFIDKWTDIPDAPLPRNPETLSNDDLLTSTFAAFRDCGIAYADYARTGTAVDYVLPDYAHRKQLLLHALRDRLKASGFLRYASWEDLKRGA